VEQGIGAVLVGEALMRAPNTRAFIRELLSWPEPETKAKGKDVAPLVKICGVRTVDEALGAAEAGADMIGLMFVARSKRYISVEQAQSISAAIQGSRSSNSSVLSTSLHENLNQPWFTANANRVSSALSTDNSPTKPLLVGVFQNQPLQEILDVVHSVKLDIVQLHGSEPAEFSKHIPVPTIRVFHVDENGQGLNGLTRPGLNEFVLLDAVRPGTANGLSGGTGMKIDWELAKEVVDQGEVGNVTSASKHATETGIANGHVEPNGAVGNPYPMPIILAGGLTPENVREAVQTVAPWAVDVSGGVEIEGGKGKDLSKVHAFIQAAKSLDS